MTKTINTRLDRDPAYMAAKQRFNELKASLNTAERKLDEALSGVNALSAAPRKDAITAAAEEMLSSGAMPDLSTDRARALESLEQTRHEVAVRRRAVELQKEIVDGLAMKVSHEICADVAQMHKNNVRAIVNASVVLAKANAAEKELREELFLNGVHNSELRPMPAAGFDLADWQSRVSRYLLEALEFGFITIDELPAHLRRCVPSKAATPAIDDAAARAREEGWIHA